MVATREASRRRATARLRWLLLSLTHPTLAGAAADDPSAGECLSCLADVARKALTPLLPAPAWPEAPERMPRGASAARLLMISFPILAYTGFALTYPEHWWAAPLLHWEATLGLRGGLHRAAALVMMGALLWHAVHVAIRPRLRACLRGSLPSRTDARLAAGMLAYWTGRRAHPPSAGPSACTEKVEYWAFLWGAVLMSTTGLVLWFNDVTLRWLPSGITDVATGLHFYEAVLASLAILVWHLGSSLPPALASSGTRGLMAG